MVGAAPARQASLRRMAEFGIRPKRDLGQNFLVDDNLLGVIGREARLGPSDVVLEVGGGLGVLSEYLAARVAFVHVLEVDPALRPALEEATGAFANVALRFEDAVRSDYAALDPLPGKLVANLPYSVAAPVLVRTVVEVPGMGLWCAMVQREIADRLVAQPGGTDYGIPSVLVQLACDVKLVRPISRTVFVPKPRVDSALVRMTRRRVFPGQRIRALVAAGFAHRRKAMAGSVALAARDDQHVADAFGLAPAALRSAVQDALVAIGRARDERAERLSPEEFEELAANLGVS